MAIFGKKKKDKFVDLSGRLDKQKEKINKNSSRPRVKPDSSGTLDLSSSSDSYRMASSEMNPNYSSNTSSGISSSSTNSSNPGNSGGGFFGNFFGSSGSSSSNPGNSTSNDVSTSDAEERRKKLAKRIQGMTNKIEELENELFRMKQRMDVLEKKQRLDY